VQPQHKGGAFKGPAKSQCLNCMDEQEYDLTVPANGDQGRNTEADLEGDKYNGLDESN